MNVHILLAIFWTNYAVLRSPATPMSSFTFSFTTLTLPLTNRAPNGIVLETLLPSSKYHMNMKRSHSRCWVALWRAARSFRSQSNMKTRATAPLSSNPIGPPSFCRYILPPKLYTWLVKVAIMPDSTARDIILLFCSVVGFLLAGLCLLSQLPPPMTSCLRVA